MNFILCGILFSTLMHAQVLTIIEHDQDGHSCTNKQISDINSQLEIVVDNMKLKELVIKKGINQFPKDLSYDISMINEALKERQDALNKVENAIELLKNGNYDGYVELLKEAANGPAELLTIPEIKQAVLELQTKNNNYVNPLRDVYEAAEGVLKTLTGKLESIAEENGIYVQMGCWLITKNEQRQIHLDGFDNIPALEEYEVPRWELVPSDAEKARFEEFKKFANENAEKGPNVIIEVAKEQLQYLKSRLQSELKKDITEVLMPITNSLRDIKDDTGNIRKGIDTINTSVENYIKFISEKADKYKNIGTNFNGDLTNLIVTVKNDFDAVINETKALKETIETQIKIIQTVLVQLPGDVKKGLTQAVEEIKQMGPRIEAMVHDWTSELKNNLNDLLKGRQFDMAALEFSKEIDKLDISNIPETTVISLKKTGYRENGDKLALKMIIGSAKANIEQITESHQLTLFMVLPHIRAIAGLIFAQSTAKAETDSTFHMSPSYNILLNGIWDKKLRRKSVIYNRIFDFSFGLNLASLDFNNDNALELGVGLVISGFCDYLQIGYGYNITMKKPYWFFGLRLPLFPGVNLSNAK